MTYDVVKHLRILFFKYVTFLLSIVRRSGGELAGSLECETGRIVVKSKRVPPIRLKIPLRGVYPICYNSVNGGIRYDLK